MKKIIGIIAIVLLIGGISYSAVARGQGRDRGGDMQYGQGGVSEYGRSYGSGYDTLTPEQREQLDALYKKHYDETAQIRNELLVKNAELRATLNTTNPEVEKARALQKEISDLRANLDLKRLELKIEERKINPDARYGRGYGRGFGRHMWDEGNGTGRGWKKGGFGPGSCWN